MEVRVLSATPLMRKDDRVEWIETGKRGTVKCVYIDGYVSLMFDDGCPAELCKESLRILPPKL